MKQIQKHEWMKQYKWFDKCIHCNCTRITSDFGSITYYREGSSSAVREEPECITRPAKEAIKT